VAEGDLLVSAGRPDHAPAVRALMSRLSPTELVRRCGRQAQRQGSQIVTKCPAHDENTPSCMVREKDGTFVWFCHGCGEGGDAIAFVAAVERLDMHRDFRRVLAACAVIGGDSGLAAEIDAKAASAPRPVPPPPAPVEPETPTISDEDFAAVAAPLLHVGRLDASPIARDVTTYLDGRGLLEAARADGWAALAPPPFSDETAKMLLQALPGLADRSGLLRGERMAWPYHQLIIPWRDPPGRVYTLQRRRITTGDPKYVFATGREARWPYGVERLASASPATPIVLVEGAIDVLAMRVLQGRRDLGRTVLGLPGVANWHDEWTALLRGRHVCIAFDRDEAGDREATKLVGRLVGVAAQLVRERPIKGAKDWGDMLVQERRAAS
jgi:DNA primase